MVLEIAVGGIDEHKFCRTHDLLWMVTFAPVAKTIVCDPVVGLTSFGRFGHQKVFRNLSHILCLKINDWS